VAVDDLPTQGLRVHRLPPRDDGLPTYNEGYLFTGERRTRPGVVVDAPWLRRLVPSARTSRRARNGEGTTLINAESVLSTFM